MVRTQEGIDEELIKDLSDDQRLAFIKMLDFIKGEDIHDAFVLKGYAGTGKTYLVNKLIQHIIQRFPKRKIAITAPTNKAVSVLKDSSTENSRRLTFITIHKLLGLKEIITATGEQLFKSDGDTDISNFKYLIVDEVSMLHDDLFYEIMEHRGQIKIIFMGDPAQIPPVNADDSIPFKDGNDYDFFKAELHKIMRQNEGNPIIEASFKLRNNLRKAQPIAKLKTDLVDNKGIVFLDSKLDRPMVKTIMETIFKNPNFAKNSNYAKVLAWRNSTVDYLNKTAREILFGKNPKRFIKGEKLIVKSPIFTKTFDNKFNPKWVIQYNTSEELQLVDVSIKMFNFREKKQQLHVKVYECTVKKEGSDWEETIKVIHEDSVKKYNDLLKSLKKTAINKKEKYLWVLYYNVLKWSADIGYNYAITAHKAQGSTYENVLLIEEDLDWNRKIVERNRIKYTSYSRPTNKLFILRSNYEEK